MRPDLCLDEFLPYRLAYTSNLVSEAVSRTYKTLFGITIPEWRLIAHTAERVGITQQEIVLRSRMDKVMVSRTAIGLVERGVMRREPHARDRRSYRLHLTEAGKRLYAEIAPKALELEQVLFRSFSAEQRHLLCDTLARIDEAARDLLAQDDPAQTGRGP